MPYVLDTPVTIERYPEERKADWFRVNIHREAHPEVRLHLHRGLRAKKDDGTFRLDGSGKYVLAQDHGVVLVRIDARPYYAKPPGTYGSTIFADVKGALYAAVQDAGMVPTGGTVE